VQVLVRDNNVDQALKALKKKMQREGIFREMRSRPRGAPVRPPKPSAAPVSWSVRGWSAKASDVSAACVVGG